MSSGKLQRGEFGKSRRLKLATIVDEIDVPEDITYDTDVQQLSFGNGMIECILQMILSSCQSLHYSDDEGQVVVLRRKVAEGSNIERNIIENSPSPIIIESSPISLSPADISDHTTKEIPKHLYKRVTHGLQGVVDSIMVETDEDHQDETSPPGCLKRTCTPSRRLIAGRNLSQGLLQAKNLGAQLLPNLLFPALPKVLRDLWVFVELFVTFFQFILAFTSLEAGVYVAYITLSTVNFILACIDGFLYFYEMGSCALIYKAIKNHFGKKDREGNGRSSETMDTGGEAREKRDTTGKCKCIHLSEKRKAQLNTWFEVIRTVLSELLLYPLIVFDLFDAVRKDFAKDGQGLTLFLIGNFYLVTSVYILRAVMLIVTLRTIRGLLLGTQTGTTNTYFFSRFVVHTLFHVFVHLSCVIAVGIKIHQENAEYEDYHASPILWIVMFGGWVVPFMGIVFFFVLNYFWVQQFSIGVFIEMISLLEGPSVADTLFEGTSDLKGQAMETSKNVLEKVNVEGIRDEFSSGMVNTHYFSKLLYPLKVPLLFIVSLVYLGLLFVFESCLLLRYENGSLSWIDVSNPSSGILIVLVILITLGNIQLVVITFIGLIGILFALLVAILPGFVSIPLAYGIMRLKRRFDTGI